ncbi:MAG TPA: winged helix-turn-helix domain-containing protein [Blastocatellia bacterium]|nr:winged helix-turn-helix domain-containing protein [Blastocatellia bacterium]
MATAKQTKLFYEFGPFRLDPEECLLVREGESVYLPPKVFDTLRVLVEHGGHVLKKEELMAKIWPDSFVEESNLAQNISALRRALGEVADGQKYIETLPKRGYRFVAPVREVREEESPDGRPQPLEALASFVPGSVLREPDGEWQIFEDSDDARLMDQSLAGSGETSPPERGRNGIARAPAGETLQPPRDHGLPQQRRISKPVLLAFATMFVALLASIVYLAFFNRAAPSNHVRTLAVLPFHNQKPDAQLDFLGFSLADALITRLSRVNSLIVRPSSAVAKYLDQEVEPRLVAEELSVDTLLTGSFLQDGENLRITVQLTDLKASRQFWSETIDLKYEGPLVAQDRVAQQVINGLQLKLTEAESARLKDHRTHSPEAYKNYLEGLYLISTNRHRLAIEKLERAVRLEPDFANAWAFIGRAYSISALQRFGGREDYRKAEAAYEQAVRLEPEDADTSNLLANFLIETNRVEEAVPMLRKVIQNHPNHAYTHWLLSYAYRYGGMLPESIDEGERARQLDPNLTSHLFNSYCYAGQFEKFLRSLPNREQSYVIFYRGLGYLYLGDRQQAAMAFDRAGELDPESVVTQIGRSLSDALAGRTAEGVARLKSVESRLESGNAADGEILYKLAQAYALLDDKPAALDALRRSIEQGFFCYPYFTGDKLLDGLRGDPGFPALLELARQRHESFKRRFFGTAQAPAV